MKCKDMKAIFSKLTILAFLIWTLGLGFVEISIVILSDPLSSLVDTTPVLFDEYHEENESVTISMFGEEFKFPFSEEEIFTAYPIIVDHKLDGVVLVCGKDENGEIISITRSEDTLESLKLEKLYPLIFYDLTTNDKTLSGLWSRLHKTNRKCITHWNLPHDIYTLNLLLLKSIIWPSYFSNAEMKEFNNKKFSGYIVKGTGSSWFRNEAHFPIGKNFYKINTNKYEYLSYLVSASDIITIDSRTDANGTLQNEIAIISKMSTDGIDYDSIQTLMVIYKKKVPEREKKLSTLRNEIKYLKNN